MGPLDIEAGLGRPRGVEGWQRLAAGLIDLLKGRGSGDPERGVEGGEIGGDVGAVVGGDDGDRRPAAIGRRAAEGDLIEAVGMTDLRWREPGRARGCHRQHRAPQRRRRDAPEPGRLEGRAWERHRRGGERLARLERLRGVEPRSLTPAPIPDRRWPPSHGVLPPRRRSPTGRRPLRRSLAQPRGGRTIGPSEKPSASGESRRVPDRPGRQPSALRQGQRASGSTPTTPSMGPGVCGGSRADRDRWDQAARR